MDLKISYHENLSIDQINNISSSISKIMTFNYVQNIFAITFIAITGLIIAVVFICYYCLVAVIDYVFS